MPVHTEDELRALFQIPPDNGSQQRLGQLIHQLGRGQDVRQSRSWRVAAACAAIVLVVIAGTLFGTRGGQHHEPGAGVSATANACGDLGPLVLRIPPTGTLQIAATVDSHTPCFYFRGYAASAFDPATIGQPETIALGGRTGAFGMLPALTPGLLSTASAGLVPSLAWQVASTDWVVVQGASTQLQTISSETGFAKLIRYGLVASSAPTAANGLGMPYWFGYIPTIAHQEWNCAVSGQSVSVEYSYSADHRTALATQVYGPDGLTGSPPSAPSGATVLRLQGHDVYVGATTIDATIAPYEFHITYTGPDATHADLVTIAQHLKFPSDISEHTTWFNCGDT